MSFKKDRPYYERKIENTKRAIEGTQKSLDEFVKQGCSQNVIDSHHAQISSYEKSLEKDERILEFLNKTGGKDESNR